MSKGGTVEIIGSNVVESWQAAYGVKMINQKYFFEGTHGAMVQKESKGFYKNLFYAQQCSVTFSKEN